MPKNPDGTAKSADPSIPVALIDIGKTNLRVEVREGPSPVRLRQPVRGWLGSPSGRRALSAQLAELAATPAAGGTLAVGAAVAGFDAASPDARVELVRALRAGFSGATRVLTVSDVRAAHAGAFAGAPGVLLVAGTGAVAFGVDSEGRSYRADGHGPLLGDEGSGGWIGRQGSIAAVRAEEGRGPETMLREACGARFGVAPGRLAGLIGQSANPAGEFGRFAPDVLQAWRAGDTVATEIVERAVTHLVATVASVLRRMPAEQRDVCLLGGVSGDADFAAAISAAVGASEPGARLTAAKGDAFDGVACLLAAQ